MNIQKFEKYEVLGNDFIIIDETLRVKKKEHIEPMLSIKQRIHLCDRNFGVGADGILTLFSSNCADLYMHITNSDGSIAEICGNGIGCAIKWLFDKGRINENYNGKIFCNSGLIKFKYNTDSYQIEMGNAKFFKPIFREINFPKITGLNISKVIAAEVLIGNKHLVLMMSANNKLAKLLGKKLGKKNRFNEIVNICFVKKINKNEILLNVFEKGVGLVKACGSAACAAVAMLFYAEKIPANEQIKVNFSCGNLIIIVKYDIKNNDCIQIQINGNSKMIFEGIVKC